MPDIDIQIPAGQDTNTHTRTVGGRAMSPVDRRAISAEYAAAQAQANAQQGLGAAQSLQETVKAEQQDRVAAELRRQQIDLAAEQQAQADRIAAAREAAAGAEDAFQKHQFHDFWSDKSVGQKIAAGFGVFLGGKPAADAIFRRMDMDFEKQKLGLAKLQEISKRKGQNINDLESQHAHENAALAVKFAKANEVTAAEMIQRLTEAGVPVVEAQNNVTVKGLLARAEEKKREALQMYDRNFSNTDVTGHSTGAADPNKANENVVFDAQGKPFARAQSPQAAKEFRDGQGAVSALGKAIQELEANYAEYGRENPIGLTKGSRERSAIMSRITLSAKTLGELGALSGPDMGLVNDIAGGKLGSVMADPEGIKNLKQLHDNAINSSMSKIGAQPTPENRARFAPAATDADAPAGGPAPQRQVAPAASRTPKAPRLNGADATMMFKARRAGDHRFDPILKQAGLI